MAAVEKDPENVESLIKQLESTDGSIRHKARLALVGQGEKAIAGLAKLLKSASAEHLRWESVMALAAISHPGVIEPLVVELEDPFADAAWAAAEGLKKFKKAAWPALLKLLISKGAESGLLRQGVHHVMAGQKEDGFDNLLAALLKALETATAAELRLAAAGNILKKMNVKF